MFDNYNRQINYLRISVTDRCNLRCGYCMPADGIRLLPHTDILTYDEIAGVVKEAVGLGITKIRLTGGEPLVRKGIAGLVSMLSAIDGISDLSMTSNGILLEEYAGSLASAGLMRINISVDTMDPVRFKQLTRGGDLSRVLAGITAARAAGLAPIKINCVVLSSSEERDARDVAAYAASNGFDIRFIHQMDLRTGEFSVVEGGDGGDCGKCNRLRLTANGKIKPCLFSDLEFDVREMGAAKAMEMAVNRKPACGSVNNNGHFYNIGG